MKGFVRRSNPWELVWGQPYIDASRLAEAIEEDLQSTSSLDFRSRLLVRDAARALEMFWGQERFRRWLAQSRVQSEIKAIMQEDLGAPGFNNIKDRLVTSINQTNLEQVFELLGKAVHEHLEVNLAGSIPTLIKGLTSRPTDDIDFVDEVPAEIREQRETIKQITKKYGLTLGHVQSHYLPDNWHTRRHYLGDFGGIRVYLVDEYDIFVSKLASRLEKHKDDLRVLSSTLDKEKARHLLLADGKAFLEDQFSRPIVEANWHFIFREPLFPPAETTNSG